MQKYQRIHSTAKWAAFQMMGLENRAMGRLVDFVRRLSVSRSIGYVSSGDAISLSVRNSLLIDAVFERGAVFSSENAYFSRV